MSSMNGIGEMSESIATMATAAGESLAKVIGAIKTKPEPNIKPGPMPGPQPVDNTAKYLLIGGVAVVGGILLMKYLKRKK